MLSFSGVHITKDYGAPTIQDIAVQTMRLCRFCGSGDVFYPVGIHLLLVADLVPKELEHHALLHDAAEACVNDVPRPMKTSEAKALEAKVTARIYASLGLELPTQEEAEQIHKADLRACNVEGRLLNVRGYTDLQPGIDPDDREAVIAFAALMDGYKPVDAITAAGIWPQRLERRLRIAIHTAQQKTSHVVLYTSAA